MGIDCQIGVDGQVVVLGIDGRGAHRHSNSAEGQITIGFHNETVPAAIIALGNRAGGQVKHTAAGTNKGYGRAEVRIRHMDDRIGIFYRAILQSQRNFDILNIVLRKREYTVLHIGTLGTTAEVHDLEHFIDLGTVLGNNRTGTGNKAIGEKETAIVDGYAASAVHLQEANRTGRRTTIGTAAI